MEEMRGFMFLKFYDERSHAESLMKGELYCNTTKSFRVPEAGKESMRYDYYESLKEKFSVEDILVKFNNKETVKINTIGGVLRIYEPDTHIFCMYSLVLPLPSDKKSIGLTLRLDDVINQKTTKLGRYVVFILESQIFLDKVDKTIRNRNYEGFRGHINYYNQNVYDGKSGYGYFKKPETHAHQREYRYVIHSNESKSKPLTMNIGSLYGTAELFETKDLLNMSITVKSDGKFEIE